MISEDHGDVFVGESPVCKCFPMVVDWCSPIWHGGGDEVIDFILSFPYKLFFFKAVVFNDVSNGDGPVCEETRRPSVINMNHFPATPNKFHGVFFDGVIFYLSESSPAGQCREILDPVVTKRGTAPGAQILKRRCVSSGLKATVFPEKPVNVCRHLVADGLKRDEEETEGVRKKGEGEVVDEGDPFGDGESALVFSIECHLASKLVEAVKIRCTDGGLTAERNPKVDVLFGDFYVAPPVRLQTLFYVFPVVRGKGGEEDSLGEVESQTSTVLKKFESLFNSGHLCGDIGVTSASVVAVEFDVHLREAFEEMMQNIHDDNEEEGGERAPLFNARVDKK